MNDPKESQKPEKVIHGMIEGRISKELEEICLVDQVYVKAEDGKQTVGKYLEQVSKKLVLLYLLRKSLYVSKQVKVWRRKMKTLLQKLLLR